MSEYHEPYETLDPATRDYHRAIKSLMEELEAVDWYQQRVVSTTDEELKKILAHNRDEEMEHAVMTLEWLRRKMPGWDGMLRTYLFKDPAISVVDIEDSEEGQAALKGHSHGESSASSSAPASQNPAGKDLGIGALKEEK